LAQAPFLFQGLNNFGLSNVAMKAACKVPQRLADRDISLKAVKRNWRASEFVATELWADQGFNPLILQPFNSSIL